MVHIAPASIQLLDISYVSTRWYILYISSHFEAEYMRV